MHANAYLQSAITILKAYDGKIPFATWSKDYFRQHRKFGSRDRKIVLRMCYAHFRLGSAFPEADIRQRIITGLLLTAEAAMAPVLNQLTPDTTIPLSLSLSEKLKWLQTNKSVFPFGMHLSPTIVQPEFDASLLVQPDLYLRIRPGRHQAVKQQLDQAAVAYREVTDDCLALSNSTAVNEVITLDKDAVIQDLNSQRVIEPLLAHLSTQRKFHAWDCCAASGGKSILLHDHFPHASLTVSDVRETILRNLRSRFKRAGITSYRSMEADVSAPGFQMKHQFELVICDAPCSGSGTWSRTPEQLLYFDIARLDHYTSLQKKIAVNASRQLKAGGYFLYITCSVFKEENEDVVAYIQQNASLNLQIASYYTGYDKKADTLFAALFKKP